MSTSPTTTPLRAIAAALPFVLAALLAVLFDVAREIPVGLACNESSPPGYNDLVSSYKSGAVLLHVGVIACTLGAIALISVGPDTGPLGIRPSTLAAFAFVAFFALVVALGGRDALTPLYLVAIALAELARPLGPQLTAALAVLVLLVAATFVGCRVAAGRTAGPRATLWGLVLLTSGHLLLVELQGEAPFFC